MIQSMTNPQQYYSSTRARRQVLATRESSAATKVIPAAVGVAVVEAAIGYEWLVSGLNKMLSPGFGSGLAKHLQSNLQGNPNRWYASLVDTLVMPHASLFAGLVEVGELLVALGMFLGAALWLSGRLRSITPRVLQMGVIAALVGGTLMSANYMLMAGNTLPGLNPANAFNEGISIDTLLTLIGVGLIVVHLAASRRPAGTAPD
jgi:thiosulfate dehydrogenase [quinone] large subunit